MNEYSHSCITLLLSPFYEIQYETHNFHYVTKKIIKIKLTKQTCSKFYVHYTLVELSWPDIRCQPSN